MSASACTFDETIATAQLWVRPRHPSDLAAENDAMMQIAEAMEASPDTALATIAESARRLCGAESAGISVAETNGAAQQFRWRACVGKMARFVGGTMPRDFSPCGVVFESRAVVLMTHPERHYGNMGPALGMPIHEVLLAPFYRDGEPVGTLWVVNHVERRLFDAGDARCIAGLARFASVALVLLAERERLDGLDRELAEVGSQMEVALKAGAIMTWTWDPIADRVYADDAMARLFGIEPGGAHGGSLHRYLAAVHPEDRPRVSSTIARASESGSTYEMEFRVGGQEGPVRWVDARGQIHRGRDGRAVRMPGVVMDITERRQVELLLRDSELKLAAQNRDLELRVAERTAKLDAKIRELETFSYSVSHDLRAPLRAMQSYAKLLQDEFASVASADAREYAERIVRSADRMDHLVRDVLVISHVARDAMPMEEIGLQEFVAGLLEAYPEYSGAEADIHVHTPLPRVIANPAALTQCLSNLLKNAIEFAVPGRKARIDITAERVGARVRLDVKDDGIGIAAGEHEKIFEIFYRNDQSTEGTGIGLAVVKAAAERMGGTISVRSSPGEGSTFCLELKGAGGR